MKTRSVASPPLRLPPPMCRTAAPGRLSATPEAASSRARRLHRGNIGKYAQTGLYAMPVHRLGTTRTSSLLSFRHRSASMLNPPRTLRQKPGAGRAVCAFPRLSVQVYSRILAIEIAFLRGLGHRNPRRRSVRQKFASVNGYGNSTASIRVQRRNHGARAWARRARFY